VRHNGGYQDEQPCFTAFAHRGGQRSWKFYSQRSDLMTHLLIARPDERPSFQTYFDPSLILIATISCLGLLVSLCAAIYGLDLSASLL